MVSSKRVSRFECQSCGAVFPKWQGQCTTCGSWEGLVEAQVDAKLSRVTTLVPKAIPLSEVKIVADKRYPSGFSEVDQVLGGGFVEGSSILLGGEPGIGKSTLAIQIAQKMSQNGYSVLYVSAEESVQQISLRAGRVGEGGDLLKIVSTSDMVGILALLKEEKPDVVILDSIQTVSHPLQPAVSGSVSQVRYCAQELVQLIKLMGMVALIIGHVTKDGQLAGPKVLEHLVDVILTFEGEDSEQFRLLRPLKNRYASTREIGVFDMAKEGLVEIKNTAALFMNLKSCDNPGSVISGVIDGGRVFLIEVQALVVSTGYGMAKRTCLGVDANRAAVMIATVEKMMGFKMGTKDIVLNVIGGMRVKEPALDLAMIVAMGSSLMGFSLGKTAVLGEVGVTGEVRMVPHLVQRLQEFEKMGFTRVIGPKVSSALPLSGKLRYDGISHIREAFRLMKDLDYTRTEDIDL